MILVASTYIFAQTQGSNSPTLSTSSTISNPAPKAVNSAEAKPKVPNLETAASAKYQNNEVQNQDPIQNERQAAPKLMEAAPAPKSKD